jgi:hypothetical protein
VCLALIGRVSESSTKEAFDFLSEVYEWQRKAELPQIPEHRASAPVPVKHLGYIERDKFVID